MLPDAAEAWISYPVWIKDIIVPVVPESPCLVEFGFLPLLLIGTIY